MWWRFGEKTTETIQQIVLQVSTLGDVVHHPSASCVAFSNYLMLIHSNNLTLEIKGKGINVKVMAGKPVCALGATCAPVI